MHILIAIIVAAWTICTTASAQSLSATSLVNTSNAVMSIVNASERGMPIRLSTGPLGQIRSLEIDSQGGTWVRGPLSIGLAVGAQSTEQVRIGSLASTSGIGIMIAMAGTQQSTGISIRDIGTTGSDNAGLMLSSQGNGIGTGIRIGGHHGSGRAALQTGIDVVGGLGLRYNALNAGVGTGIEIGGTNPPRRGIDIVSSGTDHVGVLARANTNGIGIIGVSQSSNSEALNTRTRTGVMGYAASNSALSSDTLTGLFGNAVRAGSGGTQTLTLGQHGRATSRNTQHSGTSIGVLGDVVTSAEGIYTAVAGAFIGDTTSLSLVALGGDVVLGGSAESLPNRLPESVIGGASTRTLVHMYDSRSTGRTTMLRQCLPPLPQAINLAANQLVLNAANAGVLRVAAPVNGSQISGLTGDARDGDVMHILPLNGPIILIHNDQAIPENLRFLLPNQAPYELLAGMVHTLWYDGTEQRWRILR